MLIGWGFVSFEGWKLLLRREILRVFIIKEAETAQYLEVVVLGVHGQVILIHVVIIRVYVVIVAMISPVLMPRTGPSPDLNLQKHLHKLPQTVLVCLALHRVLVNQCQYTFG